MGLFTSFQLKSRDGDTRRRAAAKLGVAGRLASVPALTPLLGDPEWTVREAAIRALGAVADVSVVPPLLDAVRRADDVRDQGGLEALRGAAVDALVQVGAPGLASLLAALGDRHARLREVAIAALGGIGGPEATNALAAALADDRSNVRQAAAPALARCAGRAGVATLGAALGHKDPATRRAAATALGTIADAAAAEALRPALADRDRSVRDAVVQALARLQVPEAVEALVSALVDGDRELRGLAASVLKSFAWTPATPRQRVVHAVVLGRFAEAVAEGDAAIEPLAAALGDRDGATRRGAAEALGHLPGERSAEALATLLGDADAVVRDTVIAALGRLGPASAVPIARGLGDRSGNVRATAGRALSAAGEAVVAGTLMASLRCGSRVEHGGATLRVVDNREALEAAFRGADLVHVLLTQAGSDLSAATLREIADLDDVILVEEGQAARDDEIVSCRELRVSAQRTLAGRS